MNLTLITLGAEATLAGQVQKVEHSAVYDGRQIESLHQGFKIDTSMGPIVMEVSMSFDPPVEAAA